MLFSSIEFLLYFLPFSLAGYYALNRLSSRYWTKLWLLLCSLFFYGWWNPHYLPLLSGSVIANYLLGMAMLHPRVAGQPAVKSIVLAFGIILNIALLAWFKYANFLVENLNVSFHTTWTLSRIALPLGISFFTIQQIAFLMDTYEEIAQEKSFLDYALFVTFFPHLLAGPILHHKQMMPQFHEIRTRFFDAKNVSIGFFIFSVGLFKKVVIADSLAVWVNTGYALKEFSTLEAWVTSLSYTFQLYFDFSGYVDMAIGLGLLFNIRLPQNFNSPYRATSVINFWERWHITLSKFITTYIYTPMIRNFPGHITFRKSMIATMLAMLIAGLWHGAAWGYIAFGGFHGVGLVINHLGRRRKIKLPVVASWIMTFLFVNVSFVLFRASTISQAFQVLQSMFGLHQLPGGWCLQHVVDTNFLATFPWIGSLGGAMAANGFMLLVLGGLLLVCLLGKSSSTLYERFQPDWRYAILQVILLVVPLFILNRVVEFVYFQF